MGLRCLLGHDFGEREVERDRREDGDEVVVAFRTVETCERCGERRLVSENKEIRPRDRAGAAASNARGDAERPAADASTPDRRTSDRPTETGGVGSIVEAAEGGDGGTVIDDADDGSAAAAGDGSTEVADDGATGTADTDPTGAVDEDPQRTDADDDAAIILTDDEDAADEADDGAPEERADAPVDADGERPDADDERPDADPSLDAAEREFGAWPETADEDEGFDASAHDDTDAGVEFGGGLTPTDDDHAAFVDAGAESKTTAEDSNGTTFVRPEGGSTPRDGATEYRCPNCGATEATGASSLRAGDICPECHKGYVAERATGEGGRNA